MSQASPLYQLIESRLGEPLSSFVAARWPDRSWRAIAQEIADNTGIRVSHETVRLWFVDRITITRTTTTVGAA